MQSNFAYASPAPLIAPQTERGCWAAMFPAEPNVRYYDASSIEEARRRARAYAKAQDAENAGFVLVKMNS